MFWEKGDEPPLNLYKETPLHIAILQKKVSMIKALLNSYHPLELQDYEGETALHNAIYTKNKEIFDLLISYYEKNRRLDINIKNNVGWTPLHLAILQGNQYMIDKLINLGADLYIKSNAGNSSIKLCKQINNLENLNLNLGNNVILEEMSDESNDEIDSNSSEYQDISDSEDDNLFQPKIIGKGII